jgi:hypothetical protein
MTRGARVSAAGEKDDAAAWRNVAGKAGRVRERGGVKHAGPLA